MTLVTPRNIQYLLGLSISSRLLVLLIQLISNILINDHHADAYRNKYHQTLSTNRSMELMLPSAYRVLYYSIEGLTKWDSQYFLEISNDGYVSEQHLAFLPLYPVFISLVKQILFDHTKVNLDHLIPTTKNFQFENESVSVKALEDYVRLAVVGVTLNNFILFPIACISLFGLTKLVKNSTEKYAKDVVWWFCFNPASIFFSACYTETLFATLTFTALFMIEYRSQIYLASHQNIDKKTKKEEFLPLNHLNRLIYTILPCLAPLALASATRSNGLVNVGFIIYQFLLKYAPLVKLDRSLWSIIAYISIILEFIQDVLVLIMSSIIAASGYITFQIYSYIKFCIKHSSGEKGMMSLVPDWCDNLVPHPYGQVQAKYWNVGLFNYYELKQLPNFLLAMPISALVLVGSTKTLAGVVKSPSASRQLPYYVQGIILTIICSISINIQVITRLLASSCPIVYWICADISHGSRGKRDLITSFFISYLVIGTILHVNYFPWT